MDDNDEKERIKEKLNFFLKEKIKVHVEKKSREFFNGVLISKKNEDIFIIDDLVLGPQHIFVSDVFDVGEFREKKGEVDENVSSNK